MREETTLIKDNDMTESLIEIIAKLNAVNDLVKRIGDDSFLLGNDTPYGLFLIIGDCIDNLKKIGGIHE